MRGLCDVPLASQELGWATEAGNQEEVPDVATTVIIPARNEEKTIGPVVGAFTMHPGADFDVYVAVDGATTDQTASVAIDWGAVPVPYTNIRGKGQLVSALVNVALRSTNLLSERIILCDGDYTGLNFDHISKLMEVQRGMAIGVPDWPDCEVPRHVTMSWPKVSGFRCLPNDLIPADAHGYLLETQLNMAALKRRMPIREVFMPGLESPFQWPLTPKRMRELQRDREWGLSHGVL